MSSFQNKDPSNLMGMFSEKYLNTPLETIATGFHHHFTKADHYKIGSAIVMLLQNNDLLNHRYQQAIAVFLLWEMYKSEHIGENPFAYIFFLALQKQEKPPDFPTHFRIPPLCNPERFFIYTLVNPITVSQQLRDMLKRTPQAIISADLKATPMELDLSFLEIPLSERQSVMPHVSRCGMPCVIPDPDSKPRTDSCSFGRFDQFCKPGQITLDGQLTCLEALVSGDSPPIRQSLRPEFLRPAPPLHSSGLEEELVWMSPSEADLNVQWDSSLGQTNAGSSEVRKLMNLALRENLQQPQSQQVIEALQRDPKIIYHVGFSPTKLPGLVEHNPVIAIEVLLKLMHSAQINDYFSQLVNMEMSLHSLEVVNRLTTTVELPAEFIHLYISNCISTCEQHADRYVQNRLVRLVCVFLQSLIRNKIIDVKDIFIEVQAFCIEFSRIREAAGLFRLLKSIDTFEPGTSPSSGLVASPTK